MSQTSGDIQPMTARAMIPAANALSAEPVPETSPVVFIDGHAQPEWSVRSITTEGPSDQRAAEVHRAHASGIASSGASVARDLPVGEVVIAQPVALLGGVTRWLPLLSGRFAHRAHRVNGREHERTDAIIDDWTAMLDRPLGEPVVAGTVEAALDEWRYRAGLSAAQVKMEMVSATIRARSVPDGRLTGRTLGAVLASLLTDHGLRVQQHLTWQGGYVRRTAMIEPATRGQPVRFRADQVGQSAANLAAVEGRDAARRPVRWIGEAAPRVVESTFELNPAWAAEAMDLSDAEYTRSESGDFESVAHVFRLWVLHEDGAFTGGEIDLGEPFDLTALFGEGRPISPQALRFGPALTLDPAGRSVGVVVERSIDSGTTWQRVTGAVRVLTDRAGILLEDDALPVDWLDANRAGAARLRVTATLRHPEPMRVIRWAGNPFTGPFDTRRVSVGRTFGWREVLPGSRFHDAVRSGALQADEADDRDALDRWLAERIAWGGADQSVNSQARPLRLTHTGLQLGLRIGDRLTHLAGRYLDRASELRLARIVHEVTSRRTVTEWRSP